MVENQDYALWEPSPQKAAVWCPLDHIPVYDDDMTGLNFEPLFEELRVHTDRISELFGVSDIRSDPDDVFIAGFEIGDDRCDVSTSPRALALTLAAQEVIYGMKTSRKDTSISRNVWNLCEVTSIVPQTILGDMSECRVAGFDDLQFIDSPPLRIILDVQKGDRSHSSSAVGKAQMLGSRIRSARTSSVPTLELASWMQDTNLRTLRSPDPKYLPWVMGGSNVDPLWKNDLNTYLYVKCFRGGTYERVYGSATNELRSCVADLDNEVVTQPVLCSKLRLRKDYLHATYGGNVAVPPGKELVTNSTPVRPIYRAVGGTAMLHGVENRLIQAGALATAKDAEIAIQSDIRNREAIFGMIENPVLKSLEKLQSQRERQKYDGALQSNSAFQRLLNRKAGHRDLLTLASSGFTIAPGGVKSFSRYDATWLGSGGKGENYNLHDLVFSEDMYLQSDLEVLTNMRVGGIPITPQFSGKPQVTSETRTKKGLWQIDVGKEEWATNIVNSLRSMREEGIDLSYPALSALYYENREWVSDDTMLSARASEISRKVTSGTLVLISGDQRLARSMARTSGLTVLQVHPLDAARMSPDQDWSVGTDLTVQALFHREGSSLSEIIIGCPPLIGELLVDTGSMSAFLSRVERGQASGERGRETPLFFRVSVNYGVNPQGHRWEVIRSKKLRPDTPKLFRTFFKNGEQRMLRINPKGDDRVPGKTKFSQRVNSSFQRFMKR